MESLRRSLSALVLAALAGCGIQPHVLGAQITVDEKHPDALADVLVDLTFDFSKFASDRVVLDRATLSRPAGYDERPALDLALGFPPDFDSWVTDPDADPDVSLVNLGTTNGELAPLCGQTLDLQVWLSRHGDADSAAVSDPYSLTIQCP